MRFPFFLPGIAISPTAAIVAGLTLVLLLVPTATRAQSPQQTLKECGLMKFGTGTIWITPSEQQLRRRLGRLDAFKGIIQNCRKDLNRQIGANNANRLALDQITAQMKEAKGDALKLLKQQKKKLEDASDEPKLLGGRQEVQANLIDLMVARDDLWLVLAAIRKLNRQMRDDYGRLGENPRVTEALAALGDGARLGPAKDYDPELRMLPDYDELVLTDAVPMFLQDKLQRISGILDERVPATFTWEPSGGRVLITANIAELAGLDLSQGKPERIPERNLPATHIKLTSLRFGRHVLHDVDVLVLPPEGEYLGARIGPEVFKGLTVSPQPEQLQLLIEERK